MTKGKFLGCVLRRVKMVKRFIVEPNVKAARVWADGPKAVGGAVRPVGDVHQSILSDGAAA